MLFPYPKCELEWGTNPLCGAVEYSVIGCVTFRNFMQTGCIEGCALNSSLLIEAGLVLAHTQYQR